MITLDIVWGVVCIIIVMINFVSNQVINTNCRYIYVGSIIVIVGSLVGLSSRPVIAGTIVFVGSLIVIWAAMTHKNRLCRHQKFYRNKR